MGNSAFYLVVVASVFKLFYQDMVVAAGGQGDGPLSIELLRTRGVAVLGYVDALAALLVALAGPVLGAAADRFAAKKRWLAACSL